MKIVQLPGLYAALKIARSKRDKFHRLVLKLMDQMTDEAADAAGMSLGAAEIVLAIEKEIEKIKRS